MISFPVLSTACFPPISYMALIAQSGSAIIDHFEHYSKQSFRNRYEIYGPNGRQSLSIPIVKISGEKILLKDTQIDFNTNWKKNHLRSIESAYSNSPFFEYYYPEIQTLILKKVRLLIDYNQLIINDIFDLCKVKFEMKFSEEYLKEIAPSNDFREAFHPKPQKINSFYRIQFDPYYQIFEEKHSFQSNLSILDLLFHLGPECENYLIDRVKFLTISS
jgi:hypothetical protein